MRHVIMLCALGLCACGGGGGNEKPGEAMEALAHPDGAIALTPEQEASARIAIAIT